MISGIFSPEVWQIAVDLTKQRAERMIEMGLTHGRDRYYGAVYTPGLAYEDGLDMSDHVVASFQIGDDLEKDGTSYNRIAHGKALIALRAQSSSRHAGVDAPWLYENGDVRWAGAVYEYGLVTSGSGFQDEIDEALSWDLLNNVQMLARLMFNRGPTNQPGNHYVQPTALEHVLQRR